jgi:hypothetical protein
LNVIWKIELSTELVRFLGISAPKKLSLLRGILKGKLSGLIPDREKG